MDTIYQKYLQQFPEQTAAVCRAEASGKLAHAYLIQSDNMKIREEFSLLLAQIAACPESAGGVPCFQCSVCRHIADGSYSELITLMPTSKSRQILIGVDEDTPDTMRWFRAQFYSSSVAAGKRKVGIISDADCLNMNAQNAFLKTLEEPPGNSIFILNTANPGTLLPTIISRCHTVLLLENRCVYDIENLPDALMALYRLQSCSSNHLEVGADAADLLIKISKQLNTQAEKTVLPKWEKQLTDAANPDLKWTAAQRKRVKDRFEAAVSAEYRRLRKIFISLIHTWFAQTYAIACGADPASLPNPEFYHHIDPSKFPHDEERAYTHLKKAEELMQNLNWNVNEELAIREFCCAITC